MTWEAPKWPAGLFKRRGYAPPDSPANAQKRPGEAGSLLENAT